MPHKHTRREKDPSTFNLPPSQIAAPLPVTAPSRKTKPAAKGEGESSKTGVKRKRGNAQKDDAPRAFKRLMAFAGGQKVKSGLDDGNTPKKSKKRKAPETADAPAEGQRGTELPTINPGERMSDFAARVDAALPLGGLVAKTTKNGEDPVGLKVRRTKKERKMHKLYTEWREEDRKIKERKQDEIDSAEEKELENETLGASWPVDLEGGESTGKKKGKKAKSKEEDPWEELKRKRAEAKVGLHDVAKAPPKLQKTIAEKLLVRGAAVETGSIPKSAGSLRRREELAGVRKAVIASYRRKTESKRLEVGR